MRRLTLHGAFFLSGFAGLVYQVVWVRHFGNAFGNTVQSAALVTAVFMLGLGVGSLLAGLWIDRRSSAQTPLKAYAAAECAIGLGGLTIAAILPALGAFTTPLSGYQLGADGWYHVSVSSYVLLALLAVVLLLPVTTLMGGTLTLLIRHVLHENLEESGWRIGVLYGVNTGGAALGAFATDSALVPALGLLATAGLAAMANFAAALMGMRLAKTLPETNAATASPAPAAQAPTRPGRKTYFVAAAIALSGFAAMGLEMAWFRFFNVQMGGYRSIFSLILATILTAMWLGSVVAGALHRRFGRPGTTFIAAQALVVVTTLALITLQGPGDSLARAATLIPAYTEGSGLTRTIISTFWQLREITIVVAIPAFLMGFAYPLCNAMVQEFDESIGRTAGGLYLANTIGAVGGSLITGFLLIPVFGTQTSMTVLAVCALLAVPAVAAGMQQSGAKVPVAAGVAGLLAVAMWLTLPPDHVLMRHVRHHVKGAKILDSVEGINEVVTISEAADGSRQLSTNGHSMSSTRLGSLRYMRLFSHFPLLHLDDPKSALVICFGVGNTLHAASLHPLERLEIADLSANVLSHASYFEKWNRGVLKDPRTAVFVQDGRSHLRAQPAGSYDLINLEPPPLGFAGVASLYSTEFYEIARSRLKKGGFITQWLPAHMVPGNTVLSIIRSFQDVFPNAILLSGAFRDLILVGRADAPIELSIDDLTRRLDERPEVRKDLEAIRVGSLSDFFGLYAGGSKVLAEATKDALPVTDDWPIMEYTRNPVFVHHVIPAEIFDPSEIRDWCVDCWLPSEQLDPRVAHLDQYLALMNGVFRAERFRTNVMFETSQPATPLPPGVTPNSPVIMESEFLRGLVHGEGQTGADDPH